MSVRRSWTRWAIVVALALIVVPVVGWSGFWVYARMRAASEMDAFLSGQSGLPVQLACAQRTIGGYPLDIALNCRDAVVTIAGDAGPVTLRFPRLTMTTRLTDPRDQTVELEGPLAASDARSQARAEWSSMLVGVRGEIAIADSVLVRGEGMTLTCEGCPDVLRRTAARGIEILAQRRGDTTDFTYSLAFNDVRNGALTALTASSEPANFVASGIITQFELPTSLRFAAETERWRRDGGEIVVDKAILDQAALHAEITGRFALDAAHRPTGQFQVGARNAATLVSAFTRGLNPLFQLAIGAALRGIDDATAKGGNDLSVKLPGKIENGSLTLGPARGIATVPPLY